MGYQKKEEEGMVLFIFLFSDTLATAAGQEQEECLQVR